MTLKLGAGTLARPEVRRGSWSLFLYPKQPESLISHEWPLSGYWRVGMKGRGAQVLEGAGAGIRND